MKSLDKFSLGDVNVELKGPQRGLYANISLPSVLQTAITDGLGTCTLSP